jgi:hypothetical protein
MERARGKHDGEESVWACITENIYYSQLSSVTLLLQLELTISHRIIQGKNWVLSAYVLSSYGISLPPACLLLTVNEARIYFASTRGII